MKLRKSIQLPSGTMIPAGTELHFSNEGLGYFNGQEVNIYGIPTHAIAMPAIEAGTRISGDAAKLHKLIMYEAYDSRWFQESSASEETKAKVALSKALQNSNIQNDPGKIAEDIVYDWSYDMDDSAVKAVIVDGFKAFEKKFGHKPKFATESDANVKAKHKSFIIRYFNEPGKQIKSALGLKMGAEPWFMIAMMITPKEVVYAVYLWDNRKVYESGTAPYAKLAKIMPELAKMRNAEDSHKPLKGSGKEIDLLNETLFSTEQ